MLASRFTAGQDRRQGRGIRKPYAASRIQRKPMTHTSPSAELWSVRTCRPSPSVTCATWSLRSDSPACPSPVFAARDGRLYGLSSRLSSPVSGCRHDHRLSPKNAAGRCPRSHQDRQPRHAGLCSHYWSVGYCLGWLLEWVSGGGTCEHRFVPLADTDRVLESWSSVPATGLDSSHASPQRQPHSTSRVVLSEPPDPTILLPWAIGLGVGFIAWLIAARALIPHKTEQHEEPVRPPLNVRQHKPEPSPYWPEMMRASRGAAIR